jgi:hypothetical protein
MMNKPCIALLLGLFLCNGLHAQSYHRLIFTADSMFAANNCAGALSAFEQAFTFNKTNPADLYRAAQAAACTGNFRNAFQFLDQAYDNGWEDLIRLKRDKSFTDMRNMLPWKTFVEKVQKKTDAREALYDKPLQTELLKVLNDDRNIRNNEIAIGNKHGWSSRQMDSLHLVMKQVDSVNMRTVSKIIDQYGWVGPEKVGKAASEAQFAILYHADPAMVNPYMPVVREAVTSGKIPKPFLAGLEDKVALGLGKKQIYGTQIDRNPDTGKYRILPIEDPEHVDERRATLGLDPMAEYLQYWKLTWDAAAFKKEQEAAGH